MSYEYDVIYFGLRTMWILQLGVMQQVQTF